jgi:hypothetical protein
MLVFEFIYLVDLENFTVFEKSTYHKQSNQLKDTEDEKNTINYFHTFY